MIRNATKYPWTSLLSKQLKPMEGEGEGGREYLRGLMQIKEVERSVERCATLLKEIFPEGVVERWGSGLYWLLVVGGGVGFLLIFFFFKFLNQNIWII